MASTKQVQPEWDVPKPKAQPVLKVKNTMTHTKVALIDLLLCFLSISLIYVKG
jgi:hypothetical protein